MNVAIRRPDRAAGRVIAVASGKGGVGKTWFSIMLARALAQHRRQVLLFDGDLGLANVDIQLGLLPKHDLSALVASQRSLADCATPYPAGGFAVLAGRAGSGALAGLDPATLERVLAALGAERAYDSIVVDLGTGLDRPVRRMAAWADTLLVIATEEPTSLTDAYAVLKLHAADRVGGDVRVIINQASSPAAGQRTFDTLARACATFLGCEPPLAGIIRRDDHVRDAIRRQALLQIRHPDTVAVQDVTRLVERLLEPAA
jgi:flagellar biosynthesis protein FlhG